LPPYHLLAHVRVIFPSGIFQPIVTLNTLDRKERIGCPYGIAEGQSEYHRSVEVLIFVASVNRAPMSVCCLRKRQLTALRQLVLYGLVDAEEHPAFRCEPLL
jgi:hypothetical protein